MIEALQALRRIAQTSAATTVTELGCLSRFQSPRQLMEYSGLVAREHSSRNRVLRGDYQNRQQSPEKGVGRGGLGVPASAERDGLPTAAAEGPGD